MECKEIWRLKALGIEEIGLRIQLEAQVSMLTGQLEEMKSRVEASSFREQSILDEGNDFFPHALPPPIPIAEGSTTKTLQLDDLEWLQEFLLPTTNLE